ncbi:lipoprotein LpqH [Mycolicibacterium fortuitum]|uniref:lipoprotein LpqH n=1 Tax=Mycolicibacterium TaxID=1866885 RepID=UPI00320498EC
MSERFAGSVIVATAAMSAVVVVGCGAEPEPGAGDVASTTSRAVAAGPSAAAVSVGGAPLDIDPAVTCSTSGGKVRIGIGAGESKITATVTDAHGPIVEQVDLGTVGGLTLRYASEVAGSDAVASRSNDAFTVRGTAVAIESDGSTAAVVRSFVITVLCP